MTAAITTLLTTIKAGRTWQEVGEYLGSRYSGAFWRLLANGDRHATIEQENLVRAACDLPALEQSPADVVAEAGIDRIVRCSKRPNTAILAAVSGDVTLVRLQVSKTGVEVPATVPITLSYRDAAKSVKREGIHGLFLSNLSAKSIKTIRGQTGNLETITTAAKRAAAIGVR